MIHFIKSETPTNIVCSVAFNKKTYFHIEYYSPMLDMGDFYVNVVITKQRDELNDRSLVLCNNKISRMTPNGFIHYLDSQSNEAKKIIASNNSQLTPDALISDEALKHTVRHFNNEGEIPDYTSIHPDESGNVRLMFKMSKEQRSELSKPKAIEEISYQDEMKAAYEYSGLKADRNDYDEQYYNKSGCVKYDAFKAGIEWYKQQLKK